MKKILTLFTTLALAALACGQFGAGAPAAETPTLEDAVIPTGEPVSDTPLPDTPLPDTPVPVMETPTTEPFDGIPVSFGPLQLILPSGLAAGINGEQFPRVEGEGTAPWDVTPGHTEITLDGYLLQDRFHTPKIYVFPATDYGLMFPGAFESLHRLNNIIGDSGGPIEDQLPAVPFFNAQAVFTAHIEKIGFQNGQGVRFLTEYAQYFAPPNNHDMFYMFQGLTADGAYYIIAIFPISSPLLPESSDPDAEVPADGVQFPGYDAADTDWETYYTLVTERLDTASPDSFAPAIDQLDRLIESITTAP